MLLWIRDSRCCKKVISKIDRTLALPEVGQLWESPNFEKSLFSRLKGKGMSSKEHEKIPGRICTNAIFWGNTVLLVAAILKRLKVCL